MKQSETKLPNKKVTPDTQLKQVQLKGARTVLKIHQKCKSMLRPLENGK